MFANCSTKICLKLKGLVVSTNSFLFTIAVIPGKYANTATARLSKLLCHYHTSSSADADKPTRRVRRSVKVTKHGTIPYVRYGFLLVCYSNFVRFEIFDFKNAVTCKTELGVKIIENVTIR